MAKRIRDEELRFSIIVNGNQAQKELFDLEKSTRKLTQTNKDLRAEQARLASQGKKGTEAYKRITSEIRENNKVIKANKAQMKALQNQIGVTGLTMGQLTRKANQLKLELRNLVPGSADYKRLNAELKQVTVRMQELRGQAKATKLSLAGIADGFNRYAALGASVIASITGVVISGQKLLDYNGKLADSQSNVQKTTGLTKEEVDDLTRSFGAFSTRTSRIELLKLAEEAGRLGITGVKDIKDFVEVANQLKVALGDDISDVQIREVGKLAKIYKVGERTGRDYKNSLLSIGSAINEVSASGANQAGFLVDYLKRQAGVSAQTKLSAEDNIAYAATFDELGQSVEVSATAMNKIWIDMFDNAEAYAKIAGVGLQEFTTLLNTDANEAMKLFLEGLNGSEEGLTVMIKKMEDLEAGGARGVQALLALASNTELLEERQVLSNKAMAEAVSLTNEYQLKNNNLAALLDKIKKKTLGWFSSEGLVSFLTEAAKGFAKLIGATEDSTEALEKERMEVLLLEGKIKNINTTQEQRVKLIKEFQKEYPGYLKNLDAEKVTNEQLTLAIKDVNKQLINKIILQKKDSEITKQLERAAEITEKRDRREQTMREETAKLAAAHGKNLKENVSYEQQALALINELETERAQGHENLRKQSISGLNDFKNVVGLYQKALQAENNQLGIGNKLREEREALAQRLGITLGNTGSGNSGPDIITPDVDPDPNPDPDPKPTITKAKNHAEDLLQVQRQAEDDMLALRQDSFEKEMLLEDFNHFRKIEDLQKKLISQELIEKAANENLRESYLAKNAAIYSQIESEDKLHELRKATILENGIANQIQTKQEAFERESQERLIAHNNELAALGANEKAKEKLKDTFNQQELQREKEHLEFVVKEINGVINASDFEGFDLDILTPEQLQAIKDRLADLGLSISEINALLNVMKGGAGSDDLGFAGEFDILGFSLDQWETTFTNLDTVEGKIQAAKMAVDAFSNAWSMYNDFVSAAQKKELQVFEKNTEKKKQKQKQLLDNGFINERQYNDSIQALDNETERKKAELEYKAAKRQKAVAMANVAMSTALAIMSIWAQVPKFDFGISAGVLTGIVGTLGALKLAMIAAQPLPAKGFQQGYYNVQREQDGKLFNAAYGGESRTGLVNKPTLFLAGEGGANFPEMIIDGAAFKQIDPMVKQALYGELARVKGFERGYVRNETAPVNFSEESSTQNTTQDDMLVATLLRTNSLLDKLERDGVIAVMDRKFQNIKKLRERLDEYDTLIRKNKR